VMEDLDMLKSEKEQYHAVWAFTISFPLSYRLVVECSSL